MNQSSQYDYIISGAGCAGLSLLMHIIKSEKLNDKKILLVDKDPKNKNDRTWCFWEENRGLFESIVYKSWEKLWIHNDGFSKLLAIDPYRYKLIRGIDFYNYCFTEIRKHPNVEFLQENVDEVFSSRNETGIVVNGKRIYGNYVFNSIVFQKPQLKRHQYWMLQHFKGFFLKANNAFDPAVATLMDFRTDQKEGTSFFYVLPFSTDTALVEYTVFSNATLDQNEYETALENYIINTLGIKDHSIEEKEFGVIPMSNYSFPAKNGNILNIGTAGGQTKASSGYTFSFIQKSSKQIVDSILMNGKPMMLKTERRFSFYDSVLLNILHHGKLRGDFIFSELFRKNNPTDVLKFLDNESTIAQDLKIISSLPSLPFLNAAVHQMKLAL